MIVAFRIIERGLLAKKETVLLNKMSYKYQKTPSQTAIKGSYFLNVLYSNHETQV